MLVLVLVLVLDRPRWRARSDGVVGCCAIVLVLVRMFVSCVFRAQFVSCEGCCRCSSQSQSAAGIQASGKWGRDEESRDGESGDMVVHCTAPLVAVSFVLRI